MGSRVAPTTVTPDPRWFNTNNGTGRSTIRSIDRNECRQTDKTGKQTSNKKINNAEVTPQRACHKPSHTNPWIQPVKGATRGWLPIGSRNMLQIRVDGALRANGCPVVREAACCTPRNPGCDHDPSILQPKRLWFMHTLTADESVYVLSG